MSAAKTATVAGLEPTAGSPLRRLAWHCRHNPKRELWFAWWTTIVFYNLFAVAFFVLSRTQPPPSPAWDTPRVVQWFNHNRYGILIGFGIMFLITGMTAPTNALIAYSMRRMSVSRAFGYSYLVLYSLSAIPGMLLMCIALTVGAMRPDRDPQLISWLYDFAFLSFVGTMGVFLIGSLVWMLAILIDKNRVFPKWFGYLNLCNALTEVVVSPAWLFKRGVFAWNGLIAWWIDMVVFGFYTGVFIFLLRRLIQREDFSTGPCQTWRRLGKVAHRFWRRGVMTQFTGSSSRPHEAEKSAKFVPGQPDMWAFVLFEALVFTSYFVVYMIFRTQNPELYLRSQAQLDLRIGVFETLVLLMSSWSMARCVQASRSGRCVPRWLIPWPPWPLDSRSSFQRSPSGSDISIEVSGSPPTSSSSTISF
ncbi:putative membrane protein [Mycobacterium xenopi 4042]|uniref:Putative membrane protein n=1 Tax=Mycobacterium xenopi 4042 TaxID=1299334 RepID=X8AEZ3_MYCXE|nr:putative membrane protein [Mycobacterium xenopi 4042]